MTPDERAEKILEIVKEGFLKSPPYTERSLELIAAQIEEVQREASGWTEAYKLGFRAAREKAKGIVLEPRIYPCPKSLFEYIAQRIGGMEP